MTSTGGQRAPPAVWLALAPIAAATAENPSEKYRGVSNKSHFSHFLIYLSGTPVFHGFWGFGVLGENLIFFL